MSFSVGRHAGHPAAGPRRHPRSVSRGPQGTRQRLTAGDYVPYPVYPGHLPREGTCRSSRATSPIPSDYTLNKIIKTFEVALLLSLGLLVTGVFVTTPHLIVLLLFTNDFVTMALATDRVFPSPLPERWRVRSLVTSALVLATGWLLFSFAIFFVARDVLELDVPQLQTLIFAVLVFRGQATVYLVRERRHLWASARSRWLVAASAGDVLAVSLLASWGILMPSLPPLLIGALLVLVVLYAAALDLLTVGVFRPFGVR